MGNKKKKRKREEKIVIVMPAYKAAKTLKKTYKDIPKSLKAKIILVDDYSPDKTVEVAKELGIHIIKHEYNIGYGGNQKTCYNAALRNGAEIVVLLHPDYQYDPKMLVDLIQPIIDDKADFTFGSRFAQGRNPLKGGMPFYRFIGNRLTTLIENLLLKTDFSEFHSGYKAYNRKLLQALPYKNYSNGFLFDSHILIDAILAGFRVKEIPIPTRYTEESSSVNIPLSLLYISQTIIYLLKKKFKK
jgi:glycosyltransferase involved in cell wall biosynthesis